MAIAERHYPDITAGMLYPFILVHRHLIEDPNLLERPDCPYSGEVKRFLSLLSPASKLIDQATDLIDGDGDQQDLEKEIRRVFKELTAYGQLLDKNDDKEKSNYFRLSTSLLEKLVTMQERAYGIRRVQEFEAIILQFLEDHCTPDLRTQLMDHLKSLA